MKIIYILRFLIVAIVILSTSGCSGCRADRGPGANINFEVEFQPDLVKFRDYHADIFIDDRIVVSVENGSHERAWIEAGDHTVRAEHDDFEPDEKIIRVAKKGSQTLYFILNEY